MSSAAPTPIQRALVVIDVQNEYFTGNLRIEYPPSSESLRNITRAMDAAHAAGIPVIVVQNRAPTTSPLFAHGSDGWQLVPEVAERHRDHWVEKSLPSAMTETDIESWSRARGVNTLTLVGYMTHNCVASTAVEALHRGFAVEYLHDASGAVPYANSAGVASAREIHHAYSVVLQSRFAAVVPTHAWIAALATQEALPRSTIYASHEEALRLAAEAAAVS